PVILKGSHRCHFDFHSKLLQRSPIMPKGRKGKGNSPGGKSAPETEMPVVEDAEKGIDPTQGLLIGQNNCNQQGIPGTSAPARMYVAFNNPQQGMSGPSTSTMNTGGPQLTHQQQQQLQSPQWVQQQANDLQQALRINRAEQHTNSLRFDLTVPQQQQAVHQLKQREMELAAQLQRVQQHLHYLTTQQAQQQPQNQQVMLQRQALYQQQAQLQQLQQAQQQQQQQPQAELTPVQHRANYLEKQKKTSPIHSAIFDGSPLQTSSPMQSFSGNGAYPSGSAQPQQPLMPTNPGVQLHQGFNGMHQQLAQGVPFPPMSAPPSPHHSQRVQSVGGMPRNAQPLGGIPLQMLAPQSPSPHANTSNDIQFLGGQWNPGAPMMIPNGTVLPHQQPIRRIQPQHDPDIYEVPVVPSPNEGFKAPIPPAGMKRRGRPPNQEPNNGQIIPPNPPLPLQGPPMQTPLQQKKPGRKHRVQQPHPQAPSPILLSPQQAHADQRLMEPLPAQRPHPQLQPPPPMLSPVATPPPPETADQKIARLRGTLASNQRAPAQVDQTVSPPVLTPSPSPPVAQSQPPSAPTTQQQQPSSPPELVPVEPRSLPPRTLSAHQQALGATLRRTSLPAVERRDETTSSSTEKEQAARGRPEKKVERKITPVPVISPLAAPVAPVAPAAPIVRAASTSRLHEYFSEPIRRAEEQARITAALQQSHPRRHPSVPAVPHQPSADILSPYAGTTAAVSPVRSEQTGRAISVGRNPSLYLRRSTSVSRCIDADEEAERLNMPSAALSSHSSLRSHWNDPPDLHESPSVAIVPPQASVPLPSLTTWFHLRNGPQDWINPVAIVPPQTPVPLSSSVPLPAHSIVDLTDSAPGPSNAVSITSTFAHGPSTSTAVSSSAGPLPSDSRPVKSGSPINLSLSALTITSSPVATPSDFSVGSTNAVPVLIDSDSTPGPSNSVPGPSDVYPISGDCEERISDEKARAAEDNEEEGDEGRPMDDPVGGMEEKMKEEEKEGAKEDSMEEKMDDDTSEPIDQMELNDDVDDLQDVSLGDWADACHDAILYRESDDDEVPEPADPDLEALEDQERKDIDERVRTAPISDEELLPSTSSASGVPQIADNNDAATHDSDRNTDNDDNEVRASNDPAPIFEGMDDDQQAPPQIGDEEPSPSDSILQEETNPVEGESVVIITPTDTIGIEEVIKDLIDEVEMNEKSDDDQKVPPPQIGDEEQASFASVADEIKDTIEGEHEQAIIPSPGNTISVEAVIKDLIDGEEKIEKIEEDPTTAGSISKEDPIEEKQEPAAITDPSDEVIVEEVIKIDGVEKIEQIEKNDSNLILLQITIPPVEIPSEETIPIDTEEVVKEEPIEPEDTEEENETQPLDELRSQSLSYAVIVEDRKEDEQKSYHAPSRSGASPTPSGSSVSSPPSPHEPRLDISEHTRNLMMTPPADNQIRAHKDEPTEDKKPHERPSHILVNKHDDDGKAFADSSLSDTPGTGQFDGRQAPSFFGANTVAKLDVMNEETVKNIAGESVAHKKDDEEVGNSGEDQVKEAGERNGRRFSSSSLYSHGVSFEDSESERERTPDNVKASERVRDDNASDDKEERIQVPRCTSPIVRSTSFLGEDKAEKKDDEKNNDNNDANTETRSDHSPSHDGIKSDEEVESTSSLSLSDSTELPTEKINNEIKNEDETEVNIEEDQNDVGTSSSEAAPADSIISFSSSTSLPDDTSQKIPKKDECESDNEDDNGNDGSAQKIPAVEGLEHPIVITDSMINLDFLYSQYTSIAPHSIPSTVNDDNEEKEEPLVSPSPSTPMDDDENENEKDAEMATAIAPSLSVAHGSDDSSSTEPKEVASGERVSLESTTSTAPRETSTPPVDPSVIEETEEAREPSIEEEDAKEDEAFVPVPMPSLPISTPQPIVIVNHDRPGTPHLTLEVVNDEEIVLPLFGPFFTIELQEIEVKKNDSSMREARIQLPVFGPQPLLAIEWKKVNDDEAASSSTMQEEEGHPADDNDVMEIEDPVLEETDEWTADDEQEETEEKAVGDDEKEKEEIPEESPESPEWRDFNLFVEDEAEENTTSDGVEEDAASTSMLIPSTSSSIPPFNPCPIVNDQSDGEQKEEQRGENPMDHIPSTPSAQSSIEKVEESSPHDDADEAVKPSDEQPPSLSKPSENPRKVFTALCSITEYGSDDDDEEEEHNENVNPLASSSSIERVDARTPLEGDNAADDAVIEKSTEGSEEEETFNSAPDPPIPPEPPTEPVDEIEMGEGELIEEDVVDENDEEAIDPMEANENGKDGFRDEERDEKDEEKIEDEGSAPPPAIDAIDEQQENAVKNDTEKEQKEISPDEEKELLKGEGEDGAIHITPEYEDLLLRDDDMSFIPPPTGASVSQTTTSSSIYCDESKIIEKKKEDEEEEVTIEEEDISPLEDKNEEIKDDARLTPADLTDSSPRINETPSSWLIPTDANASKIPEESVEGDEKSSIKEIAEDIEENDAHLSTLDHHLPCIPSLIDQTSSLTPSNDQDRKITEESVEGDEKSAIKEVEEVIEKDDDPLFCTPFLLERASPPQTPE
ncbi:hypothetical protein PRIPAC_75790, partial [Pristionchus pacificus]